MPATMAIVVITIGRARLRPASTSASRRLVPRPISSTAKSTSMMAFLVTMPMSMRMPITTGMLIDLLGDEERDDGAADRERQREQDGDRLHEAREEKDQHAVDHHQPGAHGGGEAVEDLLHHLDIARLPDLDARRQLLRRRQRADRIERLAERRLTGKIALDRDAARAVVAVDRGRPAAHLEIGDRRKRHRAARAGRDAQRLQEADIGARLLLELHADRDQPVAGVELREIGVDVAERRDADRLRKRLGRDAEIGGELSGFGRDAQLRPVELGRRHRVLDEGDGAHLARELVRRCR